MEYGLVLLWLLAYAGLAALALPATSALLSAFPRDGAGFALPVALGVVGLVAFWVGHLAFGYPALVAGIAVLAALSGAALYRGVRPDLRGYGEAMAVFAVAFGLFVAVRAFDPAVHPGGGEKFLDFGLLNSLLRTERLPPEDIWFAGRPMPYYYGGHMIAALLSRLTFTAPRYAYNLALAGFYGVFVSTAYTLAGAVAARSGRPRRSAGLFTAFFVGVASNLVPPMRFLSWAVPGFDALAGLFGTPLSGNNLSKGPANFEYWTASRVISGTINEFPFFAFLNGDMHAHMMSPGFLLLLAAVLFAYWTTPAGAVWRRRALVFGVLPPLGGLIAVVNTWSFPAVGGLTFLGLAFAPADPRTLVTGVAADPDSGGPAEGPADGEWESRAADELVRLVAALGAAVAVVAVGAVLVAPYFATTTGGRGIGLVRNRSGLWGLLLVHGVFFAVTAAYLAPRLDPGRGVRGRTLVLFAMVTAAFYAAGLLAVFPFVALGVAAWTLLRVDDDVGFETLLALGAVGLVVLVEFVYVTNSGPGRFNTVFKTYAQVWALWAVGAGVLLTAWADPAGYLAALRSFLGSDEDETAGVGEVRGTPDGGRDRPPRPSVGGVLAAALVAGLSLYAGFAAYGHFQQPAVNGDATLDALQFVETDHTTEAEAIQWIREREGQPNIVTAPTMDLYRWSDDRAIGSVAVSELYGGSAPASLTGVPTVAGWAHEIGYRNRQVFLSRVEDVRTIYDGTPRQQARLLETYRVEYVYVGPAERTRYDNTSFADRLTGVEVAHRSGSEHGEVVIYRVDPAAVGPDPDFEPAPVQTRRSVDGRSGPAGSLDDPGGRLSGPAARAAPGVMGAGNPASAGNETDGQ